LYVLADWEGSAHDSKQSFSLKIRK